MSEKKKADWLWQAPIVELPEHLSIKISEFAQLPNGWCTEEKARTMAALILNRKPFLAVEIGVWSGKSLLPIALACKTVGAKCHGIDPYCAEASVEGQTGDNAEWWGKTITPELYDSMYNLAAGFLKANALDTCTTIYRKRSEEYAPLEPIQFLHLDGNHSEQAYRDMLHLDKYLAPGAIVVLDDMHWEGGGVTKAATWMLANGYKQMFQVTYPETNDWAVFLKD